MLGLSPRPVSVIDYNQYRKLEDKRERIILKRKLYDHKKGDDLKNVTELDEKHNLKLQENEDLKKWVMKLRDDLNKIQVSTVDIEKQRVKEAKQAEQKKRQSTLRRGGAEV